MGFPSHRRSDRCPGAQIPFDGLALPFKISAGVAGIGYAIAGVQDRSSVLHSPLSLRDSSERSSGSGRPIPAFAGVARCAAGSGSDLQQHIGELLVVRCDAVVLRRPEPVGLEFRIRSLNRGLGHHCVAPEF